MPNADESHFDEYSDQNKAKHSILSGYFPAYLKALKNEAAAFHYIDGFAGRGMYEGKYPGSPLIAMNNLDSTGLITKSTVSLTEDIKVFVDELSEAVANHPAIDRLMYAPFIRRGKFADFLDDIMSREIYKHQPCATFAFIDPCGVDGVRMDDIVRILNTDYGEILLFFNYDGVNRVIGQAQAAGVGSTVLNRLFGEPEITSEVFATIRNAKSPAERETIVRDAFVRKIQDSSKATYFVPFRFESPSKERTSHYLVHCCSHSLGFKIMKEVMTKAGRSAPGEYGSLHFQNDNERGKQFSLLRFDIEIRKQEIVERIRQQSCQVSYFTKQWASRPDDMLAESTYRRILMELEASNRIRVYDKQNHLPAPAYCRKKGTLAPGYWLRIS